MKTARSLLALALPLALVACLGPATSPVNPPPGTAIAALTALDGPVADALRAQGARIQQGVTDNCCVALVIDGDHANASQIQAQKDAIRAFATRGRPVIFLDADDADDTPGIVKSLGFSTPQDSAGVIYRMTTANGVPTLEERALPASELRDRSPQARAKLIAAFLSELNDRMNGGQLRTQADPTCTAANPAPCGSLPSFSSDKPPLLRAISASRVVSFPLTIPKGYRQVSDPNLVSFQDEDRIEDYVTVSVSQDIFVNAEVLIKSGDTTCRFVTPTASVPNSCMRYSVAAYPFIVSTPGWFDVTKYNTDFPGGFGFPLPIYWPPAQAGWDLAWYVGLNGKPLGANLMTDILLAPKNDTTDGQQTVSSNATFTWGFNIGASFDISAAGVKASPDFQVSQTSTQTTSTTTTILDWTTKNLSDSVRFFRWSYAATNPGLTLQPYQGPNGPYALNRPPTGAPQGSFKDVLPNDLNRGTLRMAPTFSFSLNGGDDGAGQPVQAIDLWWTGKGAMSQVIVETYDSNGWEYSPYVALKTDVNLTPGTDCPQALSTCEHLRMDLPTMFQAFSP
jgi:hypothetical protein